MASTAAFDYGVLSDDLTASDLVGRYLIIGGETRWVDGPLAEAAKLVKFAHMTRNLKGSGLDDVEMLTAVHELSSSRWRSLMRSYTEKGKGPVTVCSPGFGCNP
ncbi:MAG TPA: hypothetical protein ENI80_01900 [Acidiferrobacteraceae bacterium]|nr:hypothetical protein [Acidiferrobacteraceae bacterium]